MAALISFTSQARKRSAKSLHRHYQRKNTGFTLVEMVTVVIILGVLVLGVSSFLIFGTRIFVDATSVDKVMGQSRFAIQRMTRDLRNAVPNSIRIANGIRANGNAWQCIEMMPIVASASYIDIPLAPAAKADTATVMPSTGTAPLVAGQSLLVYPLSPSDVYVATTNTEGKLFAIDAIGANTTNDLTVDFARPVRFATASPRQRYFAVKEAVSYCFEAITTEASILNRYSGYSFNNPSNQPSPDNMGNGVLMAENIVNTIGLNSPITYTPGTLQNNAMVHLNPLFDVQGQSFQYHHQVQVINVP
ncbi:PilW family protein [Shewanella halifaxensis]|uniref:PilW family protein n=1 Tax=Shewanella halifaxensis TaxID=271098 RepID=UPI000D59E8C1|nr:prepilin-type N-terminal cleavage/methylation domain-containing protein [Shewanella halifaxensis]